MINLATPRGLPVQVPETPAEDPSPRFSVEDMAAARAYYETNGYVIVSNLLAQQVCDEARRLWDRQIKPYNGYIYRQATARAETHVKNANRWIMNPILNLQSVDPRKFADFRRFTVTRVLADRQLKNAMTALLQEPPKVVQSMYFEGNSATWEHQDSYYLDSEVVGEMCAAWIALEDIAPRAGRFFICPGSHRIRLQDHSLYNNIAENHEKYILSVVDEIRTRELEIRAPALKKGDVLFWNALTIHGSLDSQDPLQSRSSITCHAIPLSRKFLQLQTRVHSIATEDVEGTAIYRPKDLASPVNRLILFVESTFPRLFYWAKKRAILYFVKRKASLSTA